MAASSVEDFDERLNSADCPSHIRTIVGDLRTHIANCGPVTWLAHWSQGGWGIRASVSGRIVCRMDPKPVGGYVGVRVMDAEPEELKAAGAVYLRGDAPPWVHVPSPEAAAKLVPLISRACATAQARVPPSRRTDSPRRSSVVPAPEVVAAPPPPADSLTPSSEASDARRELADLGFRKAGSIRPVANGTSCTYDVDDVTGFLVYAHVVGSTVMKIGITTPSLRSRVAQNAGTINQVKALANGTARPAKWHSRPLDRFKQQAPNVIRSGKEIEIWVLESSEEAYTSIERDLNARFATMERGWTSRLG